MRKTLLLIAAAAISQMAFAEVPKAMDGRLVDSEGYTLYTFDKDTPNSGKSVCNDKCATNWPPLAAQADAKADGPWTVITRDDGAKQWAYKGQPVYYWAKDKAAGDKTGDGVGGVWHVAKE